MIRVQTKLHLCPWSTIWGHLFYNKKNIHVRLIALKLQGAFVVICVSTRFPTEHKVT